MPRFSSLHTPTDLIRTVRAIVTWMNVDDRLDVRQRDFDAARAPAGHPDCPRASSICERLDIPWAWVLRVAAENPRKTSRLLGNLRSFHGHHHMSLEQAFVAVRQAAMLLDQPHLNATDYGRAVRMTTGRRRTPLPPTPLIQAIFKREGLGWQAGCQAAGLAEPPHPNTGRALGADGALRLFIAEVDALPRSARQLRDWAIQRDFAYQRSPKAEFEQAVDALQAERAEAGLEPLERVPYGWKAPAAAGPTGGPARRAPKGHWHVKANVIEGMARACELLEPGESLKQRTLNRIASERRGAERLPTTNAVHGCLELPEHQGETWEEWAAEAEKIARKRARLARG